MTQQSGRLRPNNNRANKNDERSFGPNLPTVPDDRGALSVRMSTVTPQDWTLALGKS